MAHEHSLRTRRYLALRSPEALALALGVAALTGCTDSELRGAEPPSTDAATDATATDAADTRDATSVDVLEDATSTDVGDATETRPDVANDATDVTPDTVSGCTSNEECARILGDLGPCRSALCDVPTGACRAIDSCVACEVDGDCAATAPTCTTATCDPQAHTCDYAPSETCCASPAACDDADPCTAQTCDAGVCGFVEQGGGGCCENAPVLATSFAPAPAFLWRSDVRDAGWSVIDTSDTPSPPAALYLGNATTMHLASAEGPYGASANFGIGKLSAGASVEVKFRVKVDLRPDPTADKLRVFVRESGGTQVEIWNRGEAVLGHWDAVKKTVALPVAGPWTLVFEYVGTSVPTGADLARVGVFVDDLQVRMDCGLTGCEPGTTCPTDDPCSVGRCGDDRQCHFAAIPGCGVCDPNTCVDADPCTRDFCDSTNTCQHQPTPSCGGCSATTCVDADPCTRDYCDAAGNCRHDPIPGCGGCGGCDDNNACTIDRCDTATGACSHEPDPTCCTQGSDCHDGNPCTANSCDNGRCVFTPIVGPGCETACTAALQCDDGDSCTVDSCDAQTGRCLNEPDPGCCQQDSDCHDGDFCTANSCDNGRCVFTPLPLPGCGGVCANNGDCDDGRACTTDTCAAGGVCQNTQIACDDNEPCTFDYCDEQVGGCVHEAGPDCACVPSTLWSRDFVEGESADIQTDGSGVLVAWRVDSVKSYSAPNALRYGNQAGDAYETLFGRNFGRATGPVISVPASAKRVQLSFKVFVDVNDDADHDLFRARAVIQGGDNLQVWDRNAIDGSTNGQWVPVTVDLPNQVLGQNIQIRFTFDTVDGNDNGTQGVFVDDIRVQTLCN